MVYSATSEEHREHLTAVFQKLRNEELNVKREKCSFAQESIKFMGHVVERGRIRVDLEKKASRLNQTADALSRKVELATLKVLASMSASWMGTPIKERIKENLKTDPVAKNIMTLARKAKTTQFWVEDDLLWAKGGCLFIPKAGDLRRTLMSECDDTL
uniref:Reverse transcriptase domain-containing protein n=1 Tax=Cannabis sativa TaxID=3483 RepID=A0A803Q094_CANSA